MKTALRLRLDMADRVTAFVKAHPDTNPMTAPVAARLLELRDRTPALLEQQRSGTLAVSTAVEDKTQIREAIQADLKALMKVARQAARKHPEISVHRRGPIGRRGDADLYNAAHVAWTEATALKDTMAGFGLSDELLASLGQNLSAFQDALDRKRQGLAAQVGAAAELESVTQDIMGVVESLDAVHAVRFRNSPEQLAAWTSARNVAWPGNGVSKAMEPKVLPAAATTPVVRVEDSKAA